MESKNQKILSHNLLETIDGKNKHQIYLNSQTLINNFFDVTVNSQKLSSIFKTIQNKMENQDKIIQGLAKDIRSVQEALKQTISEESKKSALLFTKLDMKISESSNNNYCYIMDVHKKSENNYKQLNESVERKFELINSKIGRVQDSAIEDLKNGMINIKKQIIGDLQMFQCKIQGSSDERKINLNYLFQHFSSQLIEVKQGIIPTLEKLLKSKQLEKKKKHTYDMIDLSYKKQQAQTSYKQNRQQNFNAPKIIYSTGKKSITQQSKVIIKQKNKSNEKLTQTQNDQQNQNLHFDQSLRIFNKMKRYTSFNNNNKVQQQFIYGLQEILDKIQRLQLLTNEHRQILAQSKKKQIILDEKVIIMSRKLQKNSYQLTQTKTNLRKIQSLRMDQKTIEEMRNYMKWAIRDLEQKINLKCSDEDLNKQKVKLIDKISILHENLIEKADKGQIQKALIFLQDKIKEIILLIAASNSQERQGAIMKIATKCLSCDKEMQRQTKQQNKSKNELNKIYQGQYIKSMTNRVRQRYKKQAALTLGNETCHN